VQIFSHNFNGAIRGLQYSKDHVIVVVLPAPFGQEVLLFRLDLLQKRCDRLPQGIIFLRKPGNAQIVSLAMNIHIGNFFVQKKTISHIYMNM
jgi:hypothetical protein